MQNIKYREYKKNDEESLITFLEDNFQDWPNRQHDGTKLDYYNWKHLDNPLKQNLITFAELDEDIVGCIHRDFNYIKIGQAII